MIISLIKKNIQKYLKLLVAVLLVILIFISTFKNKTMMDAKNSYHVISREKAINIVEGQPEVINFLKPGKKITDTKISTPIVWIDHETNSSWEVHVYSIEEYPKDKEFPSHTASFNWYSIDKCTGKIKCSFYIYKNGKFDKASSQYPCAE